MRRKFPLAAIIIGLLILALIVLNFVLPKISLPNIGQGTSSDVPQSINPESIKTVTLTKDGFSPASLTVKKGDTVSFLNQSGKTATVNSNPYPVNNLYKFLNLGEFANGTTVQALFDEIGSFSYHNQFIPEQQGTIVVK